MIKASEAAQKVIVQRADIRGPIEKLLEANINQAIKNGERKCHFVPSFGTSSIVEEILRDHGYTWNYMQETRPGEHPFYIIRW